MPVVIKIMILNTLLTYEIITIKYQYNYYLNMNIYENHTCELQINIVKFVILAVCYQLK